MRRCAGSQPLDLSLNKTKPGQPKFLKKGKQSISAETLYYQPSTFIARHPGCIKSCIVKFVK